MVSGFRVPASLAPPIGELMSNRPAEVVAAELNELLSLAASHYHVREGADAFMTLSFLRLP